MRNRWMVLALAGLALAGCAKTGTSTGPNTGPGRPIPIESDSITYETGPCFGACPVYSVTVRPDGSGMFTGKNFTAVTGTRAFKLTPDQYRAFAAKLAPYRPESGEVRISHGDPRCTQVATDLPSVDILWTRAIGDSQRLYYYFGCDMDKNAAMAEALGNAAEELPIEELVGVQP